MDRVRDGPTFSEDEARDGRRMASETVPSTTLSLSQFDFFELQHPFEIVRLRHEKVGGQHLLDDGSHAWQSQARLSAAAAFVLQKAVGDSCQYDVTLPTRQGAAFEVIESDLVFEFLVL